MHTLHHLWSFGTLVLTPNPQPHHPPLSPPPARLAVLLLEHAAWSGSPRHLLLAAEWCRQELAAPLGPPSMSLALSEGGRPGAAARLVAARVIARTDEPLSQPRARF